MNYEEAKYYFENTIDGIKSTILFGVIADDNIQKGISYIKELTSCDDQTAKLIWCDLKMDYGTKANNPILLAREEENKQKAREDYLYRNNAECPYCHSKNTKKISGLSKAGSVAMFGIFAMEKVGKQWHCNNCKSDF